MSDENKAKEIKKDRSEEEVLLFLDKKIDEELARTSNSGVTIWVVITVIAFAIVQIFKLESENRGINFINEFTICTVFCVMSIMIMLAQDAITINLKEKKNKIAYRTTLILLVCTSAACIPLFTFPLLYSKVDEYPVLYAGIYYIFFNKIALTCMLITIACVITLILSKQTYNKKVVKVIVSIIFTLAVIILILYITLALKSIEYNVLVKYVYCCAYSVILITSILYFLYVGIKTLIINELIEIRDKFFFNQIEIDDVKTRLIRFYNKEWLEAEEAEKRKRKKLKKENRKR